jgi:hypothetical protein
LELEAMMVFMSKAGADMMRRDPVWMMDGNFYTTEAVLSSIYDLIRT